MELKQIEAEARQLCRHKIVFSDWIDILCAVRAMQGRTTKAIANEFGLSEAQTQYRISKAQHTISKETRFRSDYRTGMNGFAKQMLAATEQLGVSFIKKKVAPKWIPYAKRGTPRLQVAA
jgi:hypothetical protein